MRKRSFRTLWFWVVFASLGALACDISTLTSFGLGSTKPQITLQAPTAGTQFHEGDDVAVQSTATDSKGIVRVELLVDGAVVRTDAPPILQGQTSFSVVQTWKAAPGSHTLSVRAYNASGTASDPALVAITVAPGAAALPSPAVQTPLAPLGAPTLSLTPTLPPTGPTTGAMATKRPPTKVPPTSTPSAPPGVWAVSIRVDPSEPKRGQPMTFFVTFLNATGAPTHYKWFVKVYEPDAKNSKGETPKTDSDLPPGTGEFQSAQWTLTGTSACQDFFARVFWVDPESKQVTEFIKPDQSGGPAAQISVCP